ncbi:DUF3450 domain-containing protein [Billgrantia endophytica]|uniref:DUF3450 domain-containing protein n=1 Tax=Billgrantia endophytica TaxID=2033802 RepID=UPI001F0BEE2F|nr:DUF3450 domain-containing protein [Halomonas endophytica]
MCNNFTYSSACWRCLLFGAALLALPASAETQLHQEARDSQRQQAELQAHIDEADDEAREMLRELRALEAETRYLDGYSDALEPRLERQAESLARREQALDSLAATRDALPVLAEGMVERLARWVSQDLPFLVEEREARIESLGASDLPPPERLERALSAWRAELDYGRELDAWRGYLDTEDSRREVDYLRVGRIGLYFLSPNGHAGGVWLADEGRWQALDEAERSEVRKGLRISRDQRAPELLTLPLSRPLEQVAEREVSS